MNILIGGFFIIGILSFLYSLGILIYSGIHASFLWFWIAAAIGSFFLVWVFTYVKNHGIVLAKPLQIAIWTIFLSGIIIFSIIEGIVIFYANQKPNIEADYMIVLGAQVRKKHITKSLKFRLDTAAKYLLEHREVFVIVSGGKGAGEDISEAQAMEEYLISCGVEKERIQKEDKSVNTNENIKFSKEYLNKTDSNIYIVTNGFHIFRAVHIAKKQGLTHAVGFPAPSDKGLLINYYIREVFAIIKDKLIGNI